MRSVVFFTNKHAHASWPSPVINCLNEILCVPLLKRYEPPHIVFSNCGNVFPKIRNATNNVIL